MWLMSVVVAHVVAADPCEAPRVRDTAPLAQAIAQDRVMAQTFTKAATACAEPGEACNAARLECSTLLASTIQKQVGFDDGQWLRDMLLPYNGGSYPMTTVFGASALAPDASCNVDVATLTAAAQRRLAQGNRRDQIFKEYGGYSKWTQTQLQKCKERVSAEDAKSAAARAESERIAAASAAIATAEAMKKKQEDDLARAKAEAERKAKEAADAEVRKQQELKDAEARKQQEAKDAAAAEAKRREEAEKTAKDEREAERKRNEQRQDQLLAQQKKDREELEAQRKKDAEAAAKAALLAKEEADRQKREEEEKRAVSTRDSTVMQQRALKERLIKDAEENLKRAKDEEALKKQAAVDAVSSSPAIAQAAVAEAAQAERARVEAEKRLVAAQQQASAIVIKDDHERGNGSLHLVGGASAVSATGGVGVALMAEGGAHFGIWGTAPSDGMASGLELRLWGRYLAQITNINAREFQAFLTARYFFGRFGLGLAGEVRLLEPNFGTIRGGVGPSLAAAFVDTKDLRVILGVSYLPLGNTIDPARLLGEFEVGWRFIDFRLIGGSSSQASFDGSTIIAWQIGGAIGLRFGW